MKQIGKLFLAAAVAFGLMACNKEEAPNVQQEKNATVSLKITRAGTRATGTPDELLVQESAIKKLEVFVFNNDVRDGYGIARHDENVIEVKEIGVTTGKRSIIVVANAPDELKDITSKTALKAKIAADLATQKAEKGLLMTSEETPTFEIKAGKNFYGYPNSSDGTYHSVDAPVKLTRVAARIAIVSAETAFEGALANYKFEPEAVFAFNVKKQSKYFGASLVEGTELLSGINFDSPEYEDFSKKYRPTTFEEAGYLKDAISDLTTLKTTPIYYYVFENDASVQPTILTLKGKIKDAEGNYLTKDNSPGVVDKNGFTYYTIIINATKKNYDYSGVEVTHDETIVRNTKYDVSLTIKNLGKDDPTDDPTEEAMLDVKVEVVPWVSVNQNVVY